MKKSHSISQVFINSSSVTPQFTISSQHSLLCSLFAHIFNLRSLSRSLWLPVLTLNFESHHLFCIFSFCYIVDFSITILFCFSFPFSINILFLHIYFVVFGIKIWMQDQWILHHLLLHQSNQGFHSMSRKYREGVPRKTWVIFEFLGQIWFCFWLFFVGFCLIFLLIWIWLCFGFVDTSWTDLFLTDLQWTSITLITCWMKVRK